MIPLSVEPRGQSRLRQQLALLSLGPGERRQVSRALGRKVAKNSKRRITQQRDLDNQKWAKRVTGKKKKMLTGLRKRMMVKAQSDGSVIRWRRGIVAWRHQHGHEEVYSAERMEKEDKKRKERAKAKEGADSDTSAKDKPATRSQAKSLLVEGYMRRKDGRLVRPSQRWIVENLTLGQAGAILRWMREAKGQYEKDKKWRVKIPGRPFLGATREEQMELVEELAEQVERRVLF